MSQKWNSYLDLFNQAAGERSDKPAIIYGDRRVSYAELSRSSDAIAGALLERSVQKGQIVPVVLKRSPEAFAAMLGIWKTGAAGTFVNTAFPPERIEEICRQCGTSLVIDEAWIQEIDPFGSAAPLNFKSACPQREDLAMVVFTSGSSGSPKGVMLPHRAIANRVAAMKREVFSAAGYDAEKDIWFSIVPLSSVIIIPDEFAILIMGGAFDIIPEELKQDPAQIVRYGLEHKITFTFVPPVLCPMLIKYFDGQMRAISTGSERVSNMYTDRMFFLNGYGASEMTGTAFAFIIDRPYENTPIGKPMEDTYAYLLDADDRLVPEGETGELCVSGEAVALGYLNDPALTAEKFTPNLFCDEPEHHILYHTGDLVRKNAEGNYEYIQRSDWMLKVAGYRVEPGEIERAMYKAAPSITKAVVVGFESRAGEVAQTRLYACFTANEKLKGAEIQEALKKFLPVYMIPAFIEQVPSLPLNLNGKIDRSKIVPPEIEFYKSDYEEPANEREKTIARGFEEVLGIPRVGALDNFVLLGGDSVSAAKLAFTLHSKTKLSVVDILLLQTPRALAVRSAEKEKERESLIVITEDTEPDFTSDVSLAELTPYQEMFYNEWLLDPSRYDYNIVEEKIFEGELCPERLNKALLRMINDMFILNSSVAAEGDRLCWKRRAPLAETSQAVQYFDQPVDDAQLFALLTKPFDLKNDRLSRYFLIKISDARFRFFTCTHHILTDGTKGNAVYAEYARYYNDPGYSYNMDAVQQRSHINALAKSFRALLAENREGIGAFWRDYSRDANPVDIKFLQGSRQDETIRPVSACRFSIGRKELDRVKIISQKYGITPFIYSELVFALLLHRMSGQSRVSFSYPVTLPEGDAIFYGSQVNTLFINFSFEKGTTVIDLIKQAKDYFYKVELHKANYLPISEISGYLDDKRVLQISFAQTNMRETPYAFEGVTGETTSDMFHFDSINTLQVQLEEKKEQLDFKFKYKNRILDSSLVQIFAGRYQRLFVEIVSSLLTDI